jgi:hypothetical protein
MRHREIECLPHTEAQASLLQEPLRTRSLPALDVAVMFEGRAYGAAALVDSTTSAVGEALIEYSLTRSGSVRSARAGFAYPPFGHCQGPSRRTLIDHAVGTVTSRIALRA